MNIFLSYSQKDQKWADTLRSGLSEAGFEVLDPTSDATPGENLHLEIGKALERSEAMIVLLSPDALSSRSVQSEIEYALSSSHFRDRLISVLVKPTAKIPWILRKQRMIRPSRNVSRTVQEVASALRRRRAASVS